MCRFVSRQYRKWKAREVLQGRLRAIVVMQSAWRRYLVVRDSRARLQSGIQDRLRFERVWARVAGMLERKRLKGVQAWWCVLRAVCVGVHMRERIGSVFCCDCAGG